MLSEGRPGVDDRYSLHDGKLLETLRKRFSNRKTRHTSSRAC